MKSDAQIQKDVMEELKWDPLLDASRIGVAVKNGVVTLSGTVDSFSKKVAAESDTKKVLGVKAIAEDIQIGVSPAFQKTDTEIAEAVVNALKWNSSVEEDRIKVAVDNGIVKLEGEVEWDYQRVGAQRAVENLLGVKSVRNLVTLKPKISAAGIHDQIRAALQRSATVDSSRIFVETVGSKVKLKGAVHSFAEKQDAEKAAWAAPGVSSVESNITIEVPALAWEE